MTYTFTAPDNDPALVRIWDEYWNLVWSNAIGAWGDVPDLFDISPWLNIQVIDGDGNITCGELQADGTVKPWDQPCDAT